jgi:hypothetical protein
LQSFGAPPVAAELIYGATQLAPSAVEAYAANKAVNTWILSNTAVRNANAVVNADNTLTITGTIDSANAGSFEQLATGTTATPTSTGYVNQAKVCANQCLLTMNDPSDQALAAQIAQSGDPTGELTEALVTSVAQKQGMTVLSGGKYGSNNGFDAVLQNADGSVTLAIDAKQITNGTLKLGQTTDGSIQLSPAWINNVLLKLDPESPAYTAIRLAQSNGTLSTAVIGVNKTTSQLVGIPVKVL